MADRFRSPRTFVRRGAKRKKMWAGGFLGVPLATASGGNTATQVITNAQLQTFGGVKGTIVRTRGYVDMAPELTGTDPVVLFGLAVVDALAFAAGVAALPVPTDLNDLFWFTKISVHALPTTVQQGGPTSIRVDIDVKAMRKYDATDIVVLLTQGAASGHAARSFFSIQCLLMEE